MTPRVWAASSALGQLENDRRRLAFGRSALLGQDVVQGPPLDERHRQIMDAVDLARVVDGAQVRMAERGRRAGLAIKPLEQFAVIVGEAGNFERDRPVELRIFRQVDVPHRAAAQRAHDAIPPESLGQRRGRRRLFRWNRRLVLQADVLRPRMQIGVVIRRFPITGTRDRKIRTAAPQPRPGLRK